MISIYGNVCAFHVLEISYIQWAQHVLQHSNSPFNDGVYRCVGFWSVIY